MHAGVTLIHLRSAKIVLSTVGVTVSFYMEPLNDSGKAGSPNMQWQYRACQWKAQLGDWQCWKVTLKRYTREITEPTQFVSHSQHGAQISNLGSLGFSHNQNNHGSAGVYVTRIVLHLLWFAVWILSTCKTPHDTHTKIVMQFCFVFVFACVVGKNLKIPNLSPIRLTTPLHGAVYTGSIQSLGSSLYICGLIGRACIALTQHSLQFQHLGV